MSKKQKLSSLVIRWKKKRSSSAQEMGKDEAKAVLEALEPYQRLEYLKIKSYGGEKLPSWFCTLKNVKEIRLDGCEHLEYIEDVMNDGLFFPSLETLTFSNMKKLKGWWRQEIVGEMQRRPCFAKVSRVTIEVCPELQGRMPLFEGIEHMWLDTIDVKLVAELFPSVNSSCSPHSSVIGLCDVKGLICLPEGWVRHLTALQSLRIHDCKGLQQVSCRGLSHLTALKVLSLESDNCEIGDNEEDDDVHVGMPWKALLRLESLTLQAGDKHLHEGLAYLTFLKDLKIIKWKGFGDGETEGVQLPSKALQNLTNLSIGFEEGSNICNLPKVGIQHLHSLQDLWITRCKELYLCWKTLLFSLKLNSLSFCRVGNVINVEDHLVVERPSQLRFLEVIDCKETKWVHHQIPWKSLTSLDGLEYEGVQDTEELPNGIQHLTSLRYLNIRGSETLKSVPTWLPHLTSLRTLYISVCSVEMKRRSERERGEDWPLIRHIPIITIKTRVDDDDEDEDEDEEEKAKKIGWCGLTR